MWKADGYLGRVVGLREEGRGKGWYGGDLISHCD